MVLQELATIGGDVVSLNNTSWRCRFRACGKGASHPADTWSKSSRLQERPVPLQMLYVPDVSRPCCMETGGLAVEVGKRTVSVRQVVIEGARVLGSTRYSVRQTGQLDWDYFGGRAVTMFWSLHVLASFGHGWSSSCLKGTYRGAANDATWRSTGTTPAAKIAGYDPPHPHQIQAGVCTQQPQQPDPATTHYDLLYRYHVNPASCQETDG